MNYVHMFILGKQKSGHKIEGQDDVVDDEKETD